MKRPSEKWFVLYRTECFQPIEADDYDSAIAQLVDPLPDLVLLDWMIPGGSGIQVLSI